MARRFCVGCGRQRRTTEYACPACRGDLYGAYVPASAKAHPEPVQGLCGVLGRLVTRLPPGAVMLLYGPRGLGKSSLAFTAFPCPFVASSEMSPALVLEYAKRLGVKHAGISEPAISTTADGVLVYDLKVGPVGPVDLIVDSATATGHPLLALQAARRHAELRGCRVILTAQVTKDGKVRGPADLEHDSDVVAVLAPSGNHRMIHLVKNRFGEERSQAYVLGAEGTRLPAWEGYYTVEGDGPDYRLAPFPSGKGHRTDVFRRAEAGELAPELPAPPLAAAAAASKLYPSGFAEPADYADRVAYCHRHGLPYFSPLHGLQEVLHGHADRP